MTVQKMGKLSPSHCSAAHILILNGMDGWVAGCICICSVQLTCLVQPISRVWDGVALDASSLGSYLGEQLLGNCFRVCWVPLGTPGSALPRSSMHLPTHCCLVPLEKISLEMLDGVPCGFPLLQRVLCVMIRISLIGKKQIYFMYKAKNSLLVSLKTG